MRINEQLMWLWVTMVFGPANRRLWELSANYSGVEEFIRELRKNRVAGVSDKERERAARTTSADTVKVYEAVCESGSKLYCYGSEGYPARLLDTANPPAVLFARGNLDFLNDNDVLTVVGAREPSEYSQEVCVQFCAELSKKGVVPAAGMAKGIDQLVLKNAVENGNIAAAVYSKAFEECQGEQERELIDRISEKGAVITEYYPGCKAGMRAFIERNRIMVGMSDAVLFIQCAETSKGLDNYDKAVSQGKQVFVVPPRDIFDKRYSGQAMLIKNGCKTVNSADDILAVLGRRDLIHSTEESEYKYIVKDRPRGTAAKKHTDTEKKRSEPKKVDVSGLSEIQAKICELLGGGDMLVDELAVRLQADIADVFMELTELEMAGIVVSKAGKNYGLS
ncbi:MAG: DNA-processing protein DprA [Ruminococcus sp.]|nr:DNA-processing protein DprA [Ruminococcus sp.]